MNKYFSDGLVQNHQLGDLVEKVAVINMASVEDDHPRTGPRIRGDRNHGDRFRPLSGAVPLPNGHSWLIDGGY